MTVAVRFAAFRAYVHSSSSRRACVQLPLRGRRSGEITGESETATGISTGGDWTYRGRDMAELSLFSPSNAVYLPCLSPDVAYGEVIVLG